jgi:hypothetical protein
MRRIARNVWVLMAFFPAAVFGQAASPSTPEEEKPVPIVLYPAAAPKPALKYQLLPPFMERIPGNAAVLWNRVPAEMSHYFVRFYEPGGPWEKMEEWMQIPLGDPREKAYRDKELRQDFSILHPSPFMSTMERAARFESCDWQQPIREGNFINMLIPEIQQSRTYARLLSAKAHLEIAQGKYDQAVRTLQTGYAEARQVAQSPILVSGMVALTIAGTMTDQVQQWIQQPDGPNLYWALSTLPRPLVDLRLAGEAEAKILYLQFPELRDLDKKRLSPGEWRELLKRVMEGLYSLQSPRLPPDAYAASITLLAISGYPSAKQFLIEHGCTVAEVEAMPVAQAVLLYAVKLYDEAGDDQFKWFYLPATEAVAGLRQATRDLRETLASEREIIPFASLLLPASTAAKEAETRSQWVMARLRILEAMRLYAAQHEGRWPDRLSDITEVPVPVNPYDGKPFIYERHGEKARLTVENGPTYFPRGFEITLKQKQS